MNIDEILNERNIKYKVQGRDLVVHCLNPEHEDQNPSMNIDRYSGIFNCLSCGFSGNIHKLFGIKKKKHEYKIQRLLDLIQVERNRKLEIELPADAKLFDRDFRNISKNTYQKFNAFTTNLLPEMEDRLVFPVKNSKGRIKSLVGRELFSNFKRYRIYPKKSSPGFFPSIPEPKDNTIILVEGIFDFLNLYDKGLKNGLCVFGLGGARKDVRQKLEFLSVMGVEKVYILFDSDEPGKKAAEELKEAILDFDVEVLELAEENTDPGALTASQVKEIIEGLYENSSNNRELGE